MIFQIRCRSGIIHSLKSTTLGCIDIEVRKSEFVAKTQFILSMLGWSSIAAGSILVKKTLNKINNTKRKFEFI